MRAFLRRAILRIISVIYANLLRPILFWQSAQDAHQRIMAILPWLDRSSLICTGLRLTGNLLRHRHSFIVGGVQLESPLILAAGFVKGHGYSSEAQALAAVASGETVIPGWRAVPALLGTIEFGSFTRHPRAGNPGVVMWRDYPTRSIQNRVGLKNPGVIAAAHFLAMHQRHLPPVFGINIAPSPGLDDAELEKQELIESLAAFIEAGIHPAWFTLNLSCPNTEDDPSGNQTEAKARALCSAACSYLSQHGDIPLWVKIGPDLSREQHRILMNTFAETGVSAVIAGNTLPMPAPGNSRQVAGMAGAQLRPHAIRSVESLQRIGGVDVIACGGILQGRDWAAYQRLGLRAGQYWSALIYRGPFAPAIIESES